jgi:hypothetical protein
MKKTTGRTHKPTSVSLPPEFKDRVQARIDTLYPKVSSFSNYIVQLMELDMQKGIVGPVQKPTKNGTTVRQSFHGFALQPA